MYDNVCSRFCCSIFPLLLLQLYGLVKEPLILLRKEKQKAVEDYLHDQKKSFFCYFFCVHILLLLFYLFILLDLNQR